MKKTLRSTLVAWFLTFSVAIIAAFLIFNSLYIHKKTRIANLVTGIYDLHLDVQKDFNVMDGFLSYEASSTDYYETGQSPFLDDHLNRTQSINEKLNEMSRSGIIHRMGISSALDSLKTDYDISVMLFDQIVEMNLERGFKDYGIVGQMRTYAHQLEAYNELDKTYVLGLRRHEKDYIIRGEEQYVEKLNNLAGTFRRVIEKDYQVAPKKKDEILQTLDHYVRLFNKLVDLDKRIGVKSPDSGKKNQLTQLQHSIENRFNQIIQRAELRKQALFRYLELFYGIFALLFLLISFFISQSITRRIAAPITTLTNHIKKLSSNSLKLDDNLDEHFKNYETSILYQEFRLLIQQIRKEQDDLKRVQAALVENEEKYRQLAEHLPQGVFETDQFGNLTYVNSTWLNSLGYDAEELAEGLNIIHVLKAESGPISIGDESKGASEYNAIRKDGSFFPALVYTNRINRDNKLIGFRGTIIDITERKNRMDRLREEKEKAEQSDRLKSTFLANISHEIRTPMGAIIELSSKLNKDLSSKEKKACLNQIQKNGERLLKLIDEIIDSARDEAGD